MAGYTIKKRPYMKMALAGVVSVALYAVLLLRQDSVNAYFSKGGMYAVLPIALAFVFSYVHGSFTGFFWSVMGIEAAKKKQEVK